MTRFCGSFKQIVSDIDAVAPRRDLTLEETRAPARKDAIECVRKLSRHASDKRRDFARKLLLDVGPLHYGNSSLWGLTTNWQTFHDVHCIVSSAMALFHELVPTLISVNEAAAPVLTMRVRIALLACVFIAIKVESEDAGYLSCTHVSGLVLHPSETGMFNGVGAFCEAVFECETRVLNHTASFRCSQLNVHRKAVELLVTMVSRGDLGRIPAIRALSVCFFLVYHTYNEAMGWVIEYNGNQVAVAFAAASLECAEAAGVRDIPRRNFSTEERAVASAILSAVLNMQIGIAQAKLGGNFSHNGSPDQKTTCSDTLLLARERLAATAYW